ncbi:MAG: glycosyltransferase [Gemmataceae bacterium]|nr:glycosyltransferase [Gemmata sp.]MDW8196354.1 glycosyltransferase [Gemmataceae bacterium]
MKLLHLTASTFFGGPERQMLGLALALPAAVRSHFASFPEGGQARDFLQVVQEQGFPAYELRHDTPHLRAAVRELTGLLRHTACDVLLCHGYKANILGRLAARRVGIPAVAVSRGWTGESFKVRLYEWLDRRHLRFMDHVVCVSEGQAAKVRRWCGVPDQRLSVIHNSARLEAFTATDPTARQRLLRFFAQPGTPHAGTSLPDDGSANRSPITEVVLAAGRLSPEKGFTVLLEAARTICAAAATAGIVIFGEGSLRGVLEARIAELGLTGRVVLPGFRADLDTLIAAADVVVLPSFTEGLPNVALEASAAGVPVVATAVGGLPEVVSDGETGTLVPPGHPAALAQAVLELLRDPALRSCFGQAGRLRMQELFSFNTQAQSYLRLFQNLKPNPLPVRLPWGMALPHD